MNKLTICRGLVLVGISLSMAHLAAAGIVNSPHDLASGSAASIKATSEDRICIFCHTPHAATRLIHDVYQGPLWGREESNLTTEYQPYASDTIKALPGQPLGPSRLCLSCHDGTIALGAPNAHKVTEVVDRSLSARNIVGTDLRDDHPVSMEYFVNSEEFVPPDSVRLLKPRDIPYVECTSCHEAHDNRYGKFLVMDTSVQKDVICTACHQKLGWQESTHKTGGARYPGATPVEVANNGCTSCHRPHGAQRNVALLKLATTGVSIDSNCYDSCHGGSAPYSNFKPVGGMNTHTLAAGATDSHMHTEGLPLDPNEKHAHCIDCHNPHQANFEGSPLASSTPLVPPASQAPNVNGPLRGVRGVSVGGVEIPAPGYATKEYEICFKCHAGVSASQFTNPATRVQRIFFSLDESERFNPSFAKSFHPVAGVSPPGAEAPPPAGGASYIYCSQCHNPHGSTQPHLLLLDNPDDFSATQTQAGYYLCYSCHSESWLMDTGSDVGKLHKAHVFGLHNPASPNPNKFYRASCSACHDPHGVPLAGGSTADNASHLINFDLRFVAPGSSYSAAGRSCALAGPGSASNCHAGAPGIYNYNTYPYSP